MPQKRNADPMELMRGKTGRLIGNLTGFLTTLKGLPSGYNKDLQEDKEALFDSLETMHRLLPVVTAIVSSLQVNRDAMAAALTGDLLATDLADYLVRKGVPFRQAHHTVGSIVRLAAERGIELAELDLSELRTVSDVFEGDVSTFFDFDRSSVSSASHSAVRRLPRFANRCAGKPEALMPLALCILYRGIHKGSLYESLQLNLSASCPIP